jgi:kumamolisin
MNGRKIFQDSVTPLPDQEGLTPQGFMMNFAKPGDTDKIMRIVFSLSMPKDLEDALEQKVANGEVVSPAELQRTYIPPAADTNALINWLNAQGYTDVKISPNGTGVYASAKASLIEQTLQVKMVRVTREGITYTAAQNAPSLPSEVANSVHAIIGLQPFRHANKHRCFRAPIGNNRKFTNMSAQAGQKLTPNISNAPPYTIAEILKAYNANGLDVTGSGQTIAILIDTVPADSDLIAFWKENKLSVTADQIQEINVNNTTLPPAEGEETLDTEWTSGIAPGANIRIYASGSLDFVDRDNALDNILTDVGNFAGMRQVSISLGLGETFLGGPTGEVATQHQKYLRLAAAGVNVFVSSGDAGSNPDDSGHNGDGPTQVEYAASDSCVIGVGGTSLVLAANGNVADETGWTSGGGGQSMFFDRTVWQKGKGVPAGTKRLVPDVSLTADPNFGALVILGGQSQQIGGTSWSAPVWTAFCALINEARVNAGKPMLPFLNTLIYPLIGTKAFRDIVAGSNGAFKAGPGYDEVTGIGVPDLSALIQAL